MRLPSLMPPVPTLFPPQTDQREGHQNWAPDADPRPLVILRPPAALGFLFDALLPGFSTEFPIGIVEMRVRWRTAFRPEVGSPVWFHPVFFPGLLRATS